MGSKTPEQRFARKMQALGEVLGKLNASDSNVQKLVRLLPRLVPSGVSNEIDGDVTGNVTQVGSQLGGVWGDASKLVGGIGSQELSQTYIDAAAAAGACRAGTHNRIRGKVTGNVIQVGNVKGDISFD